MTLPFALSTQDSSRGPTFIEPGVQCFWRHSEPFCPLPNGQRFPFPSDIAIRSGIVSLDIARRPTTIAWLIITVVVNAVKCVIGAGPTANIFQKSGKGFSPTPTHLNTPPSVKAVRCSRRIGASLNHMSPYGIFWVMNFPVMLFCLRMIAYTPATSRMPPSETFPRYRYRLTTVTPAQPRGDPVVPGIPRISENNQTAESLAGHILYALTTYGYNLRSHFRTSNAIVMRGLCGVRSALQSPLFYHNRTSVQLGTV